MAYNNVFRLLFGYRRSCSASEMFVYNNIYNFEGRLRKNINDFTMRIGSSSNVLIATLRENSLRFMHLNIYYEGFVLIENSRHRSRP